MKKGYPSQILRLMFSNTQTNCPTKLLRLIFVPKLKGILFCHKFLLFFQLIKFFRKRKNLGKISTYFNIVSFNSYFLLLLMVGFYHSKRQKENWIHVIWAWLLKEWVPKFDFFNLPFEGLLTTHLDLAWVVSMSS
jgi:hypothetical protein